MRLRLRVRACLAAVACLVYMPEGLGLWGGRARLHVQGSPGRMLLEGCRTGTLQQDFPTQSVGQP